MNFKSSIYRKTPSAGKLASRSWAYNALTRKSLYEDKHILIASRECGDVKYLREIAVPAKNIIACDIDKAAVRAAGKHGVIVHHLTIEDTVALMIKKHGSRLGSINVDLCVTLINGCPVLMKILKAIEEAKISPTVIFTYRRGRDGFNTDAERLEYFLAQCKRLPTRSLPYQSATKNSPGSPMTTMVIDLKEKKKKVKTYLMPQELMGIK